MELEWDRIRWKRHGVYKKLWCLMQGVSILAAIVETNRGWEGTSYYVGTEPKKYVGHSLNNLMKDMEVDLKYDESKRKEGSNVGLFC